MENLPKITGESINELSKEIRHLLKSGELLEWAHNEMEKLRLANPLLFGYLREHSEKFAMGVAMSMGDPQAVAMSKLISNLMLLRLLNTELKNTAKERKEWENDVGKLLDDIEGLQ